jgi:hypothetical protein
VFRVRLAIQVPLSPHRTSHDPHWCLSLHLLGMRQRVQVGTGSGSRPGKKKIEKGSVERPQKPSGKETHFKYKVEAGFKKDGSSGAGNLL